MSGDQLRRALLVIPLGLATIAGCKDSEVTAPKAGSIVSFAQGDGGVWTVNSPADPGDGTCDDANCTLREAIGAASSGGQIVFASGVTTIATSDVLVIGKSLTLTGAGKVIIDAQNSHQVLTISGDRDSPRNVTLDGLTLTKGSANSGAGLAAGTYTIVTVKNSVISGNTATDEAGGIFTSGSLSLVNSTVSGNHATNKGGGIRSFGDITIINSTIDNNVVDVEHGGGIYNDGVLSVTGSTISNNRAEDGGGLWNAAGGVATLVRSTVSGNVEESPSANVGGILSEGTLQLLSSTITKNVGFGLAVFGGTATVGNSILVGTTTPCAVGAATLTSIGHNMSNNKNACFFIAAGDIEIDGTLAFSQVLESDLKHNGGPTKTHALIARGLAVDKGYCPGETVDQRGFARPVDEPTLPNAKDGCDMGAYESQGPQVAVADLMVSQSVDKSSVKQGDKLTYTVRVQNLGPQTAPNVVLNNVLSSGVTFVEARVNNGTGTTTAPPFGETGTVTWNIGDMLNGANEYVEIKVTVLVKGKTTITNSASVTGNVADPNSANNSAAITVSVTSGKAGSPRG